LPLETVEMDAKKTASMLFLIIFLGVLTRFSDVGFAAAEVSPLSPGIIYVPGNYSTIQAAVNAAAPGDTIIVANGTYKEQIIIDKPLRLIGENRSNTIIDAFGADYAVYIKSSNVILNEFTIQNATTPNWGAILIGEFLSTISNVTITNCTVTRNHYAIWFRNAVNSTFRGNELTENTYDFGFLGEIPRYFIQDVDTSNRVNGKPVYWLIRQHNVTVPKDAGMVAAVNSTNITVKDLTLGHNGGSVLFVSTNSSVVENVTASDSNFGISLLYSYSNTIHNNKLSNNKYGIALTFSDNNTVSNNNASRCNWNIKLVTSHRNKIIANVITNSTDISGDGLMLDRTSLYNLVSDNVIRFNQGSGITLDDQSSWNVLTRNLIEFNTGSRGGLDLSDGSSDNWITENTFRQNSWGIICTWGENEINQRGIVYKNNFIDNSVQVSNLPYTKNGTWDNGAEGNYWSHLAGVDVNKDGISDVAYNIDAFNVDRYPLMEPWSRNRTYTVTAGDKNFTVNLISNSTIGGLNFNQTLKHVAFNVTGPAGARGFFNITIPLELLSVDNPSNPAEWAVTLDGILVTPVTIITWNGTHTFFYLTYDFTTHYIRIIGTKAYPEFPIPALLLLILAVVTLSVGVLRQKRH